VKASAQQTGYIHALAKKAGMDEEARRGFLDRVAGVRSTTELSVAAAITVIDRLKPLAGEGSRADGAVSGLDSAVAGKLRALWIAAYDLGLVQDRTDRAMLTFLERQTGVSHTRFLTDPGQATAAIEALKSWLARDAGVAWPAKLPKKLGGRSKAELIVLSKRSVINAQWARLCDCAPTRPSSSFSATLLDAFVFGAGKTDWALLALVDYDRVQNAIGKKLRAALATKVPPQ
jgi:phage gp16-like protein